MTVMKKTEQKDDAVSPVVGVMLMLVVTIIIAAVVAAFATGLTTSTEAPPTATFDVKITHQGWAVETVITHLGGDPIDTSRTKIVTSWTNKSNVVKYQENVALPYSNTPQVCDAEDNFKVNYDLSKANAQYNYGRGATKYQEPYLVIPGIYPTGSGDAGIDVWYGNFVINTGEIMKSAMSVNTASIASEYAFIKDGLELTKNDVVTVQLIDIPSGQLIFEKDVYVTEA